MTKSVGTVKFFNQDKGFGFIEPREGGGDVFVHITDLRKTGYDSLGKDDRVEFERAESRGKYKGVNVKIIN